MLPPLLPCDAIPPVPPYHHAAFSSAPASPRIGAGFLALFHDLSGAGLSGDGLREGLFEALDPGHFLSYPVQSSTSMYLSVRKTLLSVGLDFTYQSLRLGRKDLVAHIFITAS